MMKKTIRLILAATTVFFACNNTMAQNLNSAYFLDGYAQGHEINPAKDYDRNGYVSVPILGMIHTGITGNLGMSSILYPLSSGKLGTFMHPEVSVDEALSKFKSSNDLNADIRIELLGFGFHKWGGFNTFNVSMRSSNSIDAPYELFEALKDLQNKDYNIGDFSTNSRTWVEIGLGHSRNVTDAWRVGGKLKILLGGANADTKMKNLQLKLANANQWILQGNAEVEASIKGFSWGEKKIKEYNHKYPGHEYYEQIDFDNVDVKNPSINGWGLAFDLGAEWDLGKQGFVKGLKLSAAILDLGFIKWNETHLAQNLGDEVIFNGFNDISIKDGPGTPVKDQAHDLGDAMSDLMALQDKGTTSSTTALAATLNIGAEYRLPMYDKLKFGFLSTTRIRKTFAWNENRFSATISPLKWLEGSINLGVGTLGTSFGWVVNIHPKGFNLFVGMDHLVGTLSKQMIPVNRNSSVTMGINIPFGKVRN